MHAIEATGLVKTYKGRPAVNGVDLIVDEGDIVGLLGPNGAGKTTTIMMLLGITDPDAGSVRLLGHPMPSACQIACGCGRSSRCSPASTRRRRAGSTRS